MQSISPLNNNVNFSRAYRNRSGFSISSTTLLKAQKHLFPKSRRDSTPSYRFSKFDLDPINSEILSYIFILRLSQKRRFRLPTHNS